MTAPIFIDYASEILALEEEWKGAQERAKVAIILASEVLGDEKPILPSARRAYDSLHHVVQALVEIKTVNDGIIQGLMELFKAAIEQRHREPTSGKYTD